MPLPSAIPTEEDLGAVLEGAGLITGIPESGTEQYSALTRALGTALSRLKTETGWKPFEGESQTRTYTSDGTNMLFLDSGLLDLDTLLISGDEYTPDTDFYLLPENAALDGEPYTLIEFMFDLPTTRKAISIEGTWGRMSPLDDEAVGAVLACAAIMAGAELRGISKPATNLVEFVQGPVRRKYSESGESFGVFETWANTWSTFVNRYLKDIVI